MTDLKPILVDALSEILPTYYELFLDSKCSIPCISYQQTNDIAEDEGDTIRYANPIFQVKIWSNKLEELANYLEVIDNKLYSLGFKRISYNEMTYNNLICGVLKYECLTKEAY